MWTPKLHSPIQTPLKVMNGKGQVIGELKVADNIPWSTVLDALCNPIYESATSGTRFRFDPATGISIYNASDVLVARFNGDVEFGTHSVIGVKTLTGYVTIKDIGGTPRNLGVVS